MACQRLVAYGSAGVVNVEGGMIGWERKGFPVAHEDGVGSPLSRLYLKAGLMALIGIILGVSLSPYFLAIAATAGLMLVVTSIRDEPISSIGQSRG